MIVHRKIISKSISVCSGRSWRNVEWHESAKLMMLIMLKLDLPYYCCHVRRCRSICVCWIVLCWVYVCLYCSLLYLSVLFFLYCVCVSGVGVRLKVGGIKLRRVKGWVWEGAVPSSVGGRLGAFPRKKNQFCAKNYAILNKFWYFDICYITA